MKPRSTRNGGVKPESVNTTSTRSIGSLFLMKKNNRHNNSEGTPTALSRRASSSANYKPTHKVIDVSSSDLLVFTDDDVDHSASNNGSHDCIDNDDDDNVREEQAPPPLRAAQGASSSSSSSSSAGARSSSLKASLGKIVRHTAMAPVVASRFAVHASVKGTSAVASGVAKGTTAVASGVAKGTMAVGNGVAKGTTAVAVTTAKSVVGGSKAIMDGTGAVVGYGGRTVFAGATGLVNFTKAATTGALFTKSGATSHRQSKWDQGVACIESLLQPDSDTYQVMTAEQRKQLEQVKKLLLKGSSSTEDKIAHIPMDLIQEQKQAIRQQQQKSDDTFKASSTYILQEFAGIRNTSAMLGDISDEESLHSQGDVDDHHSDTIDESQQQTDEQVKSEQQISEEGQQSTTKIVNSAKSTAAPVRLTVPRVLPQQAYLYTPPEFTELSKKKQKLLFHILSWESIREWNFDIFELDSVTNGNALLFIGWAILGYPHAQCAMSKCCGMTKEHNLATAALDEQDGYTFVDDLQIPPSRLCNYIRAVQEDYHAENPYHNAIHAADVLQSLHALIQMTSYQGLFSVIPQIDIFSILLSAVVHDIDHPGKTNGFHANLQSQLAVIYNDNSILENWHVAKAFSHMLGVNLNNTTSSSSSIPDYQSAQNRESPFNILCHVGKEDFGKIRGRMIQAVLHTDMTKHFTTVNAMKGLLVQHDEDQVSMAWKVLMYMLHLADISSQAKPDPLFRQWTVRVTDEFFDQGDLERELGLPISPNCNRDTTRIAGSQVGFIKFVVGPAYEVLGEFIPAVKTDILPIIESNLNAWISEDAN